jgi:hypothetical protein
MYYPYNYSYQSPNITKIVHISHHTKFYPIFYPIWNIKAR